MIAESFIFQPRGNLLRNLVLFARLLRTAGVPASPDQVVDLVRGLDALDLRNRQEFKDAARASLVTSREQAAVFDQAFELFWQAWSTGDADGSESGEIRQAPEEEDADGDESETQLEEEAPPDSEADETPETQPEAQLTYSAAEILRSKDFAELSAEEFAGVSQLIRNIAWHPERRRTRRKRAASHGRQLDLRRVLRDGLRYGGETIDLTWQQPRVKRRPLVVLCDISGSMERYARVLLQFLYAISHGLEDVEAFAFGTRLTRITRQLARTDVNAALQEAASEVNDWAGGTRIGESLKTFNYEWARRVLGHGPTVIVISDGWDRGDQDLLRREISRLQLSCRRLIWLNPLLGAPDYEPLVQGIRTVLPFVDDFLPVHNLASLEHLAGVLEQTTAPRTKHRRPTRTG